MWLATGATIAMASRKLKRDADHGHVPLMGIVGAFVFAAQMVNFTIPAPAPAGISPAACCWPSCWDRTRRS